MKIKTNRFFNRKLELVNLNQNPLYTKSNRRKLRISKSRSLLLWLFRSQVSQIFRQKPSRNPRGDTPNNLISSNSEYVKKWSYIYVWPRFSLFNCFRSNEPFKRKVEWPVPKTKPKSRVVVRINPSKNTPNRPIKMHIQTNIYFYMEKPKNPDISGFSPDIFELGNISGKARAFPGILESLQVLTASQLNE